MGYNGRIDKNRRSLGVVIDEANRVIKSGLEMIDIIGEIRDQAENMDLKELDMRIGVHTGRVVAGIIGSKVVRYDIFGEGVLIANKMESNGIPGKLCVSDDTRRLLQRSAEVAREYSFTNHNVVELARIGKRIPTFIVEKRSDSFLSRSEGDEVSDESDNEEETGSSGDDLELVDDALNA